MIKKIRVWPLLPCILIMGINTIVFSQTASLPTGSGTSGDPYLIGTLDHLYWLSTNPDQWDKVYRQTSNIDASATSGWPVNLVFSTQGGSCFMGGTHPAVSGLPAYGDSNFYASISNIGGQGSSLTVNLADGGTVAFYAYYADTWGINTTGTSKSIACGSSYSFATTSTGFMPVGNINTKFTGSYDGAGYSITNLSISRDAPAFTAFNGTGLFGRTSGATIENVHVTATTVSGEDLVGVLAGDIENTTISQVTVEATTVSGNQYVGGLAGAASGTLALSETGTKVTNVNAGFAHAGGLIGIVETANTLIKNCYARADVSSGGAYAGGLFALIETTGGTLEFRNCYAEGDISVGTRTHAIDVADYNISLSSSTTVENLLMDTTNDPVNSRANISTGKTAVQMKSLSTYTDANWDFSTVWAMDAAVNDGYPYLNSEAHATIGGAGFRLLGVPSSSASYADILAETWTQGSTNADASAGNANVWTWDGSNWSTVSDLSTTPSAGQGFLTYVFSDPDYDQGSAALPVVLSTSETFYSSDVSITGVNNDGTSGAGWTLVSNPFDSWISVDELFNARNGNFSTNAYVYNPNTSSYTTLSGADGNEFFIAPYQGFFVQDLNDGTDAGAFSIPTAAKETEQSGLFYKELTKEVVPSLSFRLHSESGESATVTLNIHEKAKIGMDAMDGYMLSPLQPKSRPLLLWKAANATMGEFEDGSMASSQQFIPADLEQTMEFDLDAAWVEYSEQGEALESKALSLSWQFKDWPEQLDALLLDTITGEKIDLQQKSEYLFNSETGDYPSSAAKMIFPSRNESRFKLITQITSASVTNEFSSSIEPLELYPNYPNPFNPSTQISYSLSKAEWVQAEVFNSLGQRIRLWPRSFKSSGVHTVTFNAEFLPSGVYYFVINTDNTSQSQRMMLIK